MVKKQVMKNKIKNLLYILLVLLIFQTSSNSNNSRNKLTSLGNQDSKVVVKVFSSLSCPHCASFHGKIFDDLKKDFIDKNLVRFEHHSFPLDLQALSAEKVLKCFEDNDKKINFLSEIYEKQAVWVVGKDINTINLKIINIAKKFGLKNDKVEDCLKSEDLEEQILQERIDGDKKYSIRSTPTIFINEKKYEGEYSYKDFKKAIEKLL